MLPLVLAPLEDRLRARIQQAEDAHVAEYTARCPKNCRHARPLSNGTVGCDARRWGATEQAATACSDAKALACPGFSPPHTEDDLRTQFRAMPEAELALRWNSINELLWLKRRVMALMTTPDSAPPPASPLPTAGEFSEG